MDFGLNDEHRAIVDDRARLRQAGTDAARGPRWSASTRYPKTSPGRSGTAPSRPGCTPPNMPEPSSAAAGSTRSRVTLVERELGWTSYALQWLVARPSNILRACEGDQRERYLLPAIRGERVDCLAMTEPNAGSDVRSMTTRAVTGRRRLRPRRHQALHQLRRCRRFRDRVRRHRHGGGRADRLARERQPSPRSWSTTARRGSSCQPRLVRASRIAATTTASSPSRIAGCLARPTARRGGSRLRPARRVARAPPGSPSPRPASAGPGGCSSWRPDWAATRQQFGQPIGRFQGIGLQARRHGDRAGGRRAADAAGRLEARPGRDDRHRRGDGQALRLRDAGRVTDQAVQIFGGMGLMDELPCRAVLARRAGRADLGRHQRDPAPHHLPRHAARARRLRCPRETTQPGRSGRTRPAAC